jgi:hypothetical protein
MTDAIPIWLAATWAIIALAIGFCAGATVLAALVVARDADDRSDRP